MGVLPELVQEDRPILLRRNVLLVLDLGVHGLDGVGAVGLQLDALARQHVHGDPYAVAQEKRLHVAVVDLLLPLPLLLLLEEDCANEGQPLL
eukprot:COSAG06_NODE_6228_length_3031_cov_1.833902_1_plen_91_part_10